MRKNKPRKDLEKPQNNYGGDYCCKQYDKREDGREWCHDEGNSNWDEFIKWAKNKDGILPCKGNRHICYKLKLKWLASLSDEEKEKYLNK
jgi:hypothetical protein